MKTVFGRLLMALLVLLTSCTQKKSITNLSKDQLYTRFPVLESSETEFAKVFRLEDSVQLSTGPGHYLGGYAQLFVTLDERFVIVDEMASRSVYLFGKDGAFIRLIGNKGGGPGEYRSPIYAGYDTRDNIYVYDRGLLRVLMYNSDGEFVKSSLIKKFVDKFAIDREKSVFFYTPKPSDRGGSSRNSVFKFDSTGKLAGEFCPQPNAFDGAAKASGGGIVADSNNVVFQMSAYEYVLRAFDTSGEMIMISEEVPHHYRQLRPATSEVDASVDALLAWYRSFTSIDQIYIYKQSLVLVRTSDISGKKPVRRLDILDKSGHVLKEGIVMPDELSPFMWANDNGLYFMRQGEADGKGNVANQKILKCQVR